jgi:hypothetical protein
MGDGCGEQGSPLSATRARVFEASERGSARRGPRYCHSDGPRVGAAGGRRRTRAQGAATAADSARRQEGIGRLNWRPLFGLAAAGSQSRDFFGQKEVRLRRRKRLIESSIRKKNSISHTASRAKAWALRDLEERALRCDIGPSPWLDPQCQIGAKRKKLDRLSG